MSSFNLASNSFCSYVLLELVETERDYVKDLGAVVEVRMRSTHRIAVSLELDSEVI